MVDGRAGTGCNCFQFALDPAQRTGRGEGKPCALFTSLKYADLARVTPPPRRLGDAFH